MEKIIYALWREGSVSRETFNARMLTELATALLPHCHALRMNIQDKESLGGTAPCFGTTNPPIEAAVQIWVDTYASGSGRIVGRM